MARRRGAARRHAAPADANHAAVGESGHPIRHVFTRAIPTAQCMTCHMHQPNIFLNSYLGYTMWDYESDADLMWPGPENRLPARNPRRSSASAASIIRPPRRSSRCWTATPRPPRRAACGPTPISCARSTTG